MEQTDKPLVYKSPTEVGSTNDKKPWFKRHLAQVIYGGLFAIIALQLVWGATTLFNARYKASAAPQIQNASLGSVILSAEKKQAAVGSIVPVNVRISTGGHGTDSTDLIIKFNPAVLEASASSFFVAGDTYKDYILSQVNNNTGEIRLVGATPPNTEGFVGIGTFGTVNFIAKAVGDSPVTVSVNKDSTSESNMVDTLSGSNILERSYNTNVQIVASRSSDQSVSVDRTNSCSGYLQYCYNLVGQIGSQFCSMGRTENNACVFDPELTISCTQCDVGL